jgi:hypothetical protein
MNQTLRLKMLRTLSLHRWTKTVRLLIEQSAQERAQRLKALREKRLKSRETSCEFCPSEGGGCFLCQTQTQ